MSIRLYFHGNETDHCVIESMFSGNDQRKAYNKLYIAPLQHSNDNKTVSRRELRMCFTAK